MKRRRMAIAAVLGIAVCGCIAEQNLCTTTSAVVNPSPHMEKEDQKIDLENGLSLIIHRNANYVDLVIPVFGASLVVHLPHK